MKGKYIIETKEYKVPKRLNFNTETNISLSRYIKYYNNMETKKKLDWSKIWRVVRDFILALLTADSIRNL